MDKKEAKRILAEELAKKYRSRSYAELKKLMADGDAYEVTGDSGTCYQIEVEAIWDYKPDGDLRVIAGIDDGRWRAAFSPLLDDFVISPSGDFVGE